MDENSYRCVVVIHEGRTASAKAATDALLDAIDLGHPTVPVMLLDLPVIYDNSALADRVVHGAYDATLVLEGVRDIWTRKTGPKLAPRKSNAGRPESEDEDRVEHLMSLAAGNKPQTAGVSL